MYLIMKVTKDDEAKGRARVISQADDEIAAKDVVRNLTKEGHADEARIFYAPIAELSGANSQIVDRAGMPVV